MPSTLPVDIYVRVSRVGKRGERLISPAEQEKRSRQHAAQHGLIIGTVLPPDLDQSGGKLNRPGLNEALRRVEAGESGGIIVGWLDRLSRDNEQAHGLVRRIMEAGGRIYAPDAPADWTTPEGELQAGLAFLFATYIRKRARAGFERAKEQAIARGIPVATRTAVGYRQREDRLLEPDPTTATVVRAVFERRAAGAGPSELAGILERGEVLTSQGSRTWNKQAIYGLLSNRVYLGELSYGLDRRYVNRTAHKPIVDEALFAAAQNPNGWTLAPVQERSAHLLSGILRCAACRYALHATKTSHGHGVYRCSRRHAAGVCPAPVQVRCERIEAVAVEAFWAITDDIKAEGAERHQTDLSGLAEDEASSRRRLEQLSGPEAQDALGDRYLDTFRQRRDDHQRALAALGQARAHVPRADISVSALRADWEHMTVRERRELMGLRIDCIALRRDPYAIVVYPAGGGPVDLPRRNFKTPQVLAGFPDPPSDARMFAL